MPWPAVPFWDEECRAHVETVLNLSCMKKKPFFISLDPNGKVLQADYYRYILTLGAQGFPWSRERIASLAYEFEPRTLHSLRGLLADSDRDFLISGDGHKVRFFIHYPLPNKYMDTSTLYLIIDHIAKHSIQIC